MRLKECVQQCSAALHFLQLLQVAAVFCILMRKSHLVADAVLLSAFTVLLQKEKLYSVSSSAQILPALAKLICSSAEHGGEFPPLAELLAVGLCTLVTRTVVRELTCANRLAPAVTQKLTVPCEK